MKTDQNSNIQGTLNKRRNIKKRKNAKRALLALNLVAVIFTTTVFSNPVSVLSEEVSTDAVQSIENNAGGDAQIAEQADVQQNTAEAAPAAEAPAAEAPAAENSAEAAKAEEPSDVKAPAENAMSAEMSAAEDGVVSTDDGASSASAVQSADASSASNGSFEDAGAGNTDGTKDGIIENDAEGLNEAEGTAANEEAEDAASQEQLTYEDEHVKISASYTDGRAFTADSILTGTYLDSDEKNAVLSAVNTQISKGNSADTVSDTAENTESSGSTPVASTTATTVEYSVAGFHALMLAAKNQDGSDTTTEGDVTFSAEFKKGLNDAGYASREETTENNEAGGDGSLTTTTTRCETSWKIYTVTEKNLTDITDITDAHNTHYEMDENGTLKSASFRGALPQTVAFVQIMKKTVTETTKQKKTEKATEKEDMEAEVHSSAAMPAVAFDQKVTTENGTVMVHVDAEEGAFEEGTSMTVTPVTRHDILDKAIDAAGGKGAAVAMDITFTKVDGTKTEPLKPIHVKMISPVLNHAEEAHVVHVADSGTIDVVAKKSDGKTIESTSSEAASSDAKNAVSFESDSFSVYAIVYTVDFEYSVNGKLYQFSLHGGEKITLSDLVEVLGIIDDTNNGEKAAFNSVDSFLKEVADVKFSDESLVKVTKNEEGDDWTLESLAPFDTDESLTITMKNGDVVTVKVTDLQYTTSLNDVLTDLTINGADWDAATESYTVKPGKSYTVNMTFQESETGYQFSNDDWMTLNLPSGVTFETGSTFDITVNEAGENFKISGNQIISERGTIKIKFNNNDSNYKKLKDITTAKFSVSVTGKFNSNQNGYVIDGQTDTKVNVDGTPDVNVTKSGSVVDWNSNNDTAKVKYRLEVRSNGDTTGVVINDAIEGTGLTFDGVESISVKQGERIINDWQKRKNGNGFTLTTGALEDGKTYIVEYTATIDKSKLKDNDNGTYDLGAHNTVSWPGKPAVTNHDLDHVVTKPGMSKNATGSTQSGSVTTTTWTIEADSAYGNENQLKTITDSLASDGMKYDTTKPIHVKVTDPYTDRVVKEANIDWNSVEGGPNSWSYDFTNFTGESNQNKRYHYTITYNTTYDIGDATEAVNIKNGWEDNRGNKGESQTQVQPNPENRYNLWKEYTSKEITTEGTIVTWTIHVTVPAAGVPADKAVLTETLPSTGSYQDTYAGHNDNWVTGLLSGETVEVTVNNDGTVLFTFTTDGTNPGLKANGNPSNSNTYKARDITLTIKTKCNTDWLNDESVNQTHDNKVNFVDREGHAYFTPDKPSSRKNGWRDGEEAGLPKFTYDVVVGVISDDLFSGKTRYKETTVGEDSKSKYIEITDTFDSRLAYVTGSAKVYGGDQNSQQNGETALGNSAVYDADNHKITFKLYQSDLPKNNGNLYQYYRVRYSLKINSETDLESMRNEAISTGKAIELDNSVTGFGGSGTKVNYEPNILEKTHNTVDGKLEFTIKVNEEGLKLSDDGVLVLTDDMTNLSVGYQDVTVSVAGDKTVETTDADGNPVTAPYFNMKGNRLTFYLPDEAVVTIKYRATPRGEVGSDGKIHYSNTAKLLGFEKTDSGEKDYQSEASGYGTNYGVYIYKADGNVNSNALGGAEFKLYEADEVDANGNIVSGTPVKMADGSDYTVTTSDGKDGSQKGLVLVMGTEELGWNLKPEKRYYLLETKAPEGYALDPTKYSFIISKDGYVNYTSSPVVAPDGSGKLVQAWTYHNGDVMTVKNYRKDGVLTLEKSFDGNIDPSKMTDDQKAAIKFEIYTISGEGSETTETLWRTITYDQFIAETVNNDDGTSITHYTYTIGDLPEGKYKVKEVVSDATCKSTTYQVTDTDEGTGSSDSYATVVISAEDVSNHTENKVDVTNTYEIPSELNIFKHAEGETSYKVAGAKFGVFAVEDATWNPTGDALATYTTNARGRFSILKDAAGSYTFEFDKVYALVETEAPAGFLRNETPVYFYFQSEWNSSTPTAPDGKQVVVIPFKETKEQNISDTPDTTSLEATKVYLNDLLEPEDPDGVTSVAVRIKQIASYDKAGKVVEDELSGYYKVGSTRPATTADKATTFTIVKDGNSWHLQDVESIVVDGKTIENVVVNGKLQNLPTMTFDNHIPIYYHYEVEEINPGDYIPSYEYVTNKDGSTTATVTNKPNTNNPTTRVKAQKKWVDIEGNDITSKMGLDDGVTVDVYRYVGLLTRGTIYEEDGTMRDPSQQFAMTFTDSTNNGTPGAFNVPFLPGDRVRISIKPTAFQNGKTFETLTSEPNLRSNWDSFKQGEDYVHYKDTESGQYIFEFTSRADDNNNKIRIEQFSEVSAFEWSVENLNAEGRSQVLSQADLIGIPDGTEAGQKAKVETLELNKANGWFAISGEYIKSATISGQVVTYSYFVVEPDGSNYEAEYHIDGDTITTVNVDKKLEVDKTWFAANGDNITNEKDNGSVTYTIKRNTYRTPEPQTCSVDYTDLKLTMDNGTVPVNASNVTIASNILVGSTIKMVFRLPDDHSNAQNSPMDGLKIMGGNVLSDSGAKTVTNNGHNHAEREYQILVTAQQLKLYGTLTAERNAAGGLKIDISILKEPSGTYIPSDTDEPTASGETVGTVTVGYDSIVSANFTDENIKATVGSTPWSVVINKLPGSDGTYTYTYYVEEKVTTSDDFTNESITPSQGAPVGGKVQVVNKLKSGELKVKKAVAGAAPADKSYEIAVRDAEGNYFGTDGTNYGQVPHYETFRANDEKIWTPLTPGMFTVSEKNASVDDSTWTVSGTGDITVVQGETAETTVTNSYFKDTEYTPKVTKSLKEGDDEVSSWPNGANFDFYLTFIEGYQGSGTDKVALTRNDIVMNGRHAQATEDAKTASFGKIDFKKPGTYIFEIEEVEPAGTQNHKKNGIVYSTEKVTLTVVVGEKTGGKLEVTSATYSPANGKETEVDKAGLITNTMDYPTYAPTVTKSLKKGDSDASAEDWNGKSFTFNLANITTGPAAQNVIMPSSTEKTVTSSSTGHKETFGAITFKAAGTYTFTVTEQQGTETNIQYDTTAKTISVTVAPDDDGNLSVKSVDIDGTEVTGNSIIGSGVTIQNTIVETTDFEFTKEWHDISDQVDSTWGGDITVTVQRRIENGSAETVGKYTIHKGDSGFTITKDSSTSGAPNLENKSGFTFKITDLPKNGVIGSETGAYTYFVTEDTVTGYRPATYSNPSTSSTDNWISSNDGAYNGGKIINTPESSYELPSTGGSGDLPWVASGILLILLAGAVFMVRKFLIYRSRGKGGGLRS